MYVNEPSVVSQSRIEETDFNIAKIVILALFSIGTSMAMMYEIGEFLSSLQYAFLWFGVITFLMFLVLNILNTFFIKRFTILASIILLETVLPTVFFFDRIKTEVWPLAIGFSLFFIFVLAGARQGKSHLANSIKVKFFSITKLVTPKLVTGALVGVSIVFYMQCFSLGGACVEGMGKELLNQTLSASKPIINIWIPNISPDQTINEFFKQFALSEMARVQSEGGLTSAINLKSGISDLPIEVRNQIINKFAGEIRNTVEQKTGALNTKESVRNEVFRLISAYIGTFSDAAKSLISISLAVLFFFSLKGFGFLLYWLIDLIAFLVYKLLIAANFAAVNYETRNREFVILP
jgi:hypothetical protein